MPCGLSRSIYRLPLGTPAEASDAPGKSERPDNSSELHMLSTPRASLGEHPRGTLAGCGKLLSASSTSRSDFPTSGLSTAFSPAPLGANLVRAAPSGDAIPRRGEVRWAALSQAPKSVARIPQRRDLQEKRRALQVLDKRKEKKKKTD